MSSKDSRTIGDSSEETREYHLRYLRAVNNPLRRQILRAMKQGDSTVKAIQSTTGLDRKTLEWHLDILEHGFCVEKEVVEDIVHYRLTKEGEIVDYVGA